jgi:BirA family biotin operon repressor/biotin-[acetyl-CoA-carboxylase] ligase
VSSLGHPRLHLRRIGSTNDRARELAIAGAPHGTLVTAGEQTAGRGRNGRRWSAPAGSSLLMSLVLRSPPALLPLIAAVAVCDIAGDEALVKWPNDIMLAGPAERVRSGSGETSAQPALAKLAGILVEARPQQQWAVLGIGVNVAVRLDDLPVELQPAPRGGASSTHRPAATLGRAPAEIEPLLRGLLDALEHRLEQAPEATLEAWRARDALRGREIEWAGGRGQAEGIDGAGRLVVALPDGGHTTLAAGEVHLRALG